MRFSSGRVLLEDSLIPLAVPNLIGNEEEYLKQCIATNFVSSVGPFVREFEIQLARRLKSQFAVATNSGTSALHLMLISVGVKPGDLVIVPSYSFVATANAVSMAGATPWFMDIELSSWGLDPNVLREELKLNCISSPLGLVHKVSGARIAAIMPVYAAGHPPRVSDLRLVAKEFQIPLVFDSAAAIGSKADGQEIGEIGSTHSLSFNGNKTITCGGGGAVILSEEGTERVIRHISTTARTSDGYSHDEIGFNYRLTNVQAAIGVAQLEQLDFFLERKRLIAKTYKTELAEFSGGEFPSVPTDTPSDWISGLILKDSHRENISEIIASLAKSKIQARESWSPIHEMKPYRSCLSSTMESMNFLRGRVLILPNSTSLTSDEQEMVVQSVRRILTRL
jgi:dTDP-4-amino-4,6-dideoxygalactose transaminase